MWEHFFTHENTVPHSYNTGLLIIHTNYPHPHAAVSIILLFFLALLLHNVFSQKSSDDNCTITDGPFHIPRVPRIGCTAQSCLSYNQAKAEYLHNTSNTFTCTANTCTNTISSVCTRVCCYHGNSVIYPNITTSKLQTLE